MESDTPRPRGPRTGPKRGVGIGTPEDWKRLGDLLRRRRGALGYPGLTRREFVRDRVPLLSLRTIKEIENASRRNPSTFQLETLEQIAGSYATTWESMRAVIEGAGELAWAPGTRPRSLPSPAPDTPYVRAAAEAGARVAAVRPWVDPIMDRLLALGGGDPDGGALFPGDPQAAETWDRHRGLGWTPLQRVWIIAEIRRLDAEDDPAVTAAG